MSTGPGRSLPFPRGRSAEYVRCAMNRAFCRSAVVACVVTVAAGAAAATASAAQPPCRELVRFNPLSFPATPAVTNIRLPLIPGWQRVYQGRSNVSGQSLPHQVTFTVTDLTKVIGGVRTVVVHDVDYTNGQLAEQELSFWAQDNQGNVWNLGEYPEEWINGVQLKGAPSTWMAGLDGAVPGIHMPVRLPEPGEDPYLQGYVPKINFLDCATTFQTGTTACVPVGCFRGVVVNDETSPLDPGSGSQRKSYAAGVGIIDIGFVDDPQGERLVLTQNAPLEPDALAAVRNAVPGGERRTVRLALTSRARQLLRSRHHLPVVVRTRGARAADRLVVARLSLTLSAPG